MKRIVKVRMKRFLVSALSTLLILALFSGLAEVEKNTRHVAFGEVAPFFSYEKGEGLPTSVKFHFMGKDLTVRIPPIAARRRG